MVVPVDQIIGNPNVVQFLADSNVQQQLQNNYAMEFLDIRFTGTAVLAGYTTNPSKYVESLENLFGGYTLTATGKGNGAVSDTLCNVDANFLRFKQHIMEGTDVVRTDVGTSNGTYNFETNLRKYFIDPRSNHKYYTRLFTSTLSSLTAAIQFRDSSALVYGGVGGTTTLSNCQVTTQVRQYLGLSPMNPQPYVKETQRTFAVNAQQNGFVCGNVPVGNVLRRQYFKGLVGPVPYADPSASIFGAVNKPEGPHLQFQINQNTTLLDQVYGQLVANDKSLFGVESFPAGYAEWEPARNAKLAASIPLKNVNIAQNNIDVAFTSGSLNNIQITDEQIVAISAAQYNS